MTRERRGIIFVAEEAHASINEAQVRAIPERTAVFCLWYYRILSMSDRNRTMLQPSGTLLDERPVAAHPAAP